MDLVIKNILKLSLLLSLIACQSNPITSITTPEHIELKRISFQTIPTFAIKPSPEQVSVNGQIRIPASLVLSDSDTLVLNSPSLNITAPPQGITAPPQGITAPPQGILPDQSIFGIKAIKSEAASIQAWGEFFRDNFTLKIAQHKQSQIFINQSVIQNINGTPYLVANYVIPNLPPNQSIKLEAYHPFMSLYSRFKTGSSGQTLAADIDLGTTILEMIQSTAQANHQSIDFSFIESNISKLETISQTIQQKFKDQSKEGHIDQQIQQFIATAPHFSQSISLSIDAPKHLVLKAGESYQITATTTFDNQSTSHAAFFASHDGSIINMSADGHLLALRTGLTKIEASTIDNPSIIDVINVQVVDP